MTAIWKTAAGGEAVLARYREFLKLWPGEAEPLRVPTAQGETFVIASGPKGAPPVLLLHGSASNAASWMGEAARLVQHFRVYAVDMIGEPGLSAAARPLLASHVYADWLGEVMAGLGVSRAALVGISLGGWLALEYATRRPDTVSAVALLCPGGVGRHKNILIWALPLLMLGKWGRQQIMRRMAGGAPQPTNLSPAAQAYGAFMDLTFANFRPRTEVLPPFADAELARLDMPLLAILGAKDVMIDSAGTRERLARNVAGAEVVWLPQAGHLLIDQGCVVDAFLQKALIP
ncbi:MAG: alpha/beta hydrolase [Phenylobacterium sp.]|uniref:alpha/beta fold hydrolase n=1 Tax=Phenylobacterium sp. TaxID=1871053 RepID=UPI001A453890|nr:alpha/beta hydrolase [Phenylobacterium sp.]MBL8555998.1 alpha/beta hydrolase [Phenylobacterium sp.]